MKVICFLGFHKFGEAKEYSKYIHPFRIITGQLKICIRCGKQILDETKVLTYGTGSN
jgi:hypothetical protein